MSCETCLQAKPLPRCLSLLKVGSASANTDYKVRFKSSMGRIDYLKATSDGAGLITVDLTGMDFMESVYSVSVKKVSDGTSAEITVGTADPVDCIEVAFEDGTSDAETIEAKDA